MAKKHKKRFKINTKNLFKKALPVQTKPTIIQGIQTTRIQPIKQIEKPKMDSFEKSFLKLSKHIKKQKRQQNNQQQKQIKQSFKPLIKTKTPDQQLPTLGKYNGSTSRFALEFLKANQNWLAAIQHFGTKGVLNVFNNTITWLKSLNVKTSKLENRIKKLFKKDINVKTLNDFQAQFKKLIKTHKIPITQSPTKTVSFNKKPKTKYWHSDFNHTLASVISSLIKKYQDWFIEGLNGEVWVAETYYWESLDDSITHIDLFGDIFDLSKTRGKNGVTLYRLTDQAAAIYHQIKSGNNPYEGKKPLIFTLEPEMI